ncbi:Cox20/FAM36A [Niveomyces insectorum RCEF 264]|uniref:Cytochrome c oxidase assembly protein COX20, mitochondrial n=1 Tax=Niveomyces insectorum RCEF 264 TaxID=1081102 RepID=A0A167XR22_9HYPO|nr:Cox20/FAM36A [Niveomyces insectorum RCEF 264]
MPGNTAGPPAGTPATWGAQHFDRAPTRDELAALSASSQQQPDQLPQPSQPQQPQHQQQQQQQQQQQPPRPPSSASVTDAVKSIKAQDFLQVYQYPCARQGFLTGIGGGAVVGMVRYIVGGTVPKAANWAVGTFALGGIVAFEVCQAARRAERAKLQRVVAVYDRKQAEQRRQQREAEAAAAEAERRRQQQQQQEEAAERARRRWYKFW